MNPKVKQVEPTDNHTLIVTFENDEVREFDVNPYLDKGIFAELKDLSYFRQVKVVAGSVEWPHEQDFSYDTLYLAGSIRIIECSR
ncbi:MAG: DUF2442 domain-containing protein [Candidatus Hinthialibacter antarcticus]|nr:DUF2442 domain-containing protein [Candidatus Hinthialibacter antarcticus]